MTTTIYAAYHRAAPRLGGSHIVPIHVGRAQAQALPQMIGDDTGDNISARNGAWCELTALYWAWKNDTQSDYIGLMHYRRVLDLTDTHPDGPVEHFPQQFDVDDWSAGADQWLESSLADFDIVVPRAHAMGRTVAANYTRGHAPQDWAIMRDVIAREFPQFIASFDAVADGHEIRLGNMAVMSRPIFETYCAFVFGVLFGVENTDVDRGHYSVYQGRYLGFLAERLMSVFIHHIAATKPDIRIKEVAILNTSKALVTPYLCKKDAPAAGVVNIALSADRAYLPHCAAMLRSLLDHADPAREINLFFLHSGIESRDLAVLETMLRERPKTRFHPLDTAGWFDNSYRSSSRAPSNATYNRFLLFSLLPGLDRLLYLDVDMIVQADVCALYDSDIGSAQLAAVPDWIMTRTLSGPIATIDPDVPDLGAYHREALGLNDAQIGRYFNAGVLIFNFAAMEDPAAIGKALIAQARDGKYLFRDQDILNRTFKDSYHALDPRWNVFNSTDASYGKVPRANHAKAMEARNDPWILHFADRSYKPWRGGAVPHAGAYWSALIRTPFYGEVVRNMAAASWGKRAARGGVIVRTGRSLATHVPALRGPLLRVHAWAQGGH